MASPPPPILAAEPRPRRLPDWIDAYVEMTKDDRSPEMFRKWAAIATLAQVLERKVWAETFEVVFPNMYIFLVGPSGAGKTVAFAPAIHMLDKWEDNRIAPTRVSIQSLMDAMANNQVRILLPRQKDMYMYHSLRVFVSELGVFMHIYDSLMAANLTDIWDGTSPKYEESKRTGNIKHNIANPTISILASTTPEHLQRILPDGAWSEGFMSRTMIIYSEAATEWKSMFTKKRQKKLGLPQGDKLKEDVAHDLVQINNILGEIEFTEEAMMKLDEWDRGGREPLPLHPKLRTYCERRGHQLVKLCQIASVSRSATKQITVSDFDRALGWLLEAERALPDAFKQMSYSGDKAVMDEGRFYVVQETAKRKGPIPDHNLAQFLSNKTSVQNVSRLIEMMTRLKMISVKFDGKVRLVDADPTYRP